jgi:hypothetical protein
MSTKLNGVMKRHEEAMIPRSDKITSRAQVILKYSIIITM